METIIWLIMHIGVMVNDAIPDISKYTLLDGTFTPQELCKNHLSARLRSDERPWAREPPIFTELPPVCWAQR